VKAYVLAKKSLPFDHTRAGLCQPAPLVLASVCSPVGACVAPGQPGDRAPRSRILLPAKFCRSRFDHNFKVELHTDLARFVEGRIDLMVDNGLQGLFLILLTLVVFLDRRVAFWAATGLPVTFLGTFLMMSLMGVSLNLVSLMGLIIVLSIDVDEAIVMGENVYRHMEEGEPSRTSPPFTDRKR